MSFTRVTFPDRSWGNTQAAGPRKSATVYPQAGESIDAALRRFKRGVGAEGIFRELRLREGFVKPSERRRRKSMLARKRFTRDGY